MTRQLTTGIRSHVANNSMEDIRVVTDHWAKMFEKKISNQEDEQKYVPPSKRAILSTPSIPQITLPPAEPVPPIQSALPEAPPDPQHNSDTQKGEQHQPRHQTNHHKLSFPEYNGNEEPSHGCINAINFLLLRIPKWKNRCIWQLFIFTRGRPHLVHQMGAGNWPPKLAPIFRGD
jgi:hypothetical protein